MNDALQAQTASAPGAQGRPIVVILNRGSGANEKQALREQIEQALAPAGERFSLIEIAPTDDIEARCEHEVARAAAAGGIVAAAGGDGTINTVARMCEKHGAILGLISAGTFNYFAREMGVPEDPGEAARLLLDPAVQPIPVGMVNGQLFLNNASLGLYTRIIREREHDKSRFGRSRLVALLSAVTTMLRGYRPMDVTIQVAGVEMSRRTNMIYVCNNPLQMANLHLDVAGCGRETLAVVIMRPVSWFGMVMLLLRSAFKRLNHDEHLEMFCTQSLRVDTRRRKIKMVVDGEIVRSHTPLTFQVEHGRLSVAVPQPAPPVAEDAPEQA